MNALEIIKNRIETIEKWDIPNVSKREAEFCRREVAILQSVAGEIWLSQQEREE